MVRALPGEANAESGALCARYVHSGVGGDIAGRTRGTVPVLAGVALGADEEKIPANGVLGVDHGEDRQLPTSRVVYQRKKDLAQILSESRVVGDGVGNDGYVWVVCVELGIYTPDAGRKPGAGDGHVVPPLV